MNKKGVMGRWILVVISILIFLIMLIFAAAGWFAGGIFGSEGFIADNVKSFEVRNSRVLGELFLHEPISEDMSVENFLEEATYLIGSDRGGYSDLLVSVQETFMEKYGCEGNVLIFGRNSLSGFQGFDFFLNYPDRSLEDVRDLGLYDFGQVNLSDGFYVKEIVERGYGMKFAVKGGFCFE